VFDEEKRLAALAEYGFSPGAGQEEFAGVVKLAARVFQVPTVLVSLVERDRQIFAASFGFGSCGTSRSKSFCSHVIAEDETMVILDARQDPRFCANPFVTGAPHIRFYAGAPLRAPTRHVIGTFCLVDTKPRPDFSAADRRDLEEIAAIVLEKMEVRRLEGRSRDHEKRFASMTKSSPDAILCADDRGIITFWNESAEHLFGFSAEEATGELIDIVVPDRVAGNHGGGLAQAMQGCAPRLIGKTLELSAQRKDGSAFPIELSLSTWSEAGRPAFGVVARDISQRRLNERKLFKLAHHDHLTDLPNLMVLRTRIEAVVDTAASASLLFLDLDGFKDINDTLGHIFGDLVLKEVAGRLLNCVGSAGTIARMGGDEFAFLLPGFGDIETASAVAEEAIRCLHQPFEIEGQAVNLSASVGIALFPGDAASSDDLLSAADLALYHAKESGRNCCRAYAPDLRGAALAKRLLELELMQAVENEEFELYYQPQVRGASATLIGVEALLRWRHPRKGLLTPRDFLSTLESGRLATRVGAWVIKSACKQAGEWRRQGAPALRMGINLFGVQLRTGNLLASVRSALKDNGLPPSGLELEITENIILQDATMCQALVELQRDGVRIAFDDYGTGHASLSLLKHYRVSRLKIDQSFVRNMCTSPEDAAIVGAVTYLGKTFGLEVLAEGVETAGQRKALLELGCEDHQGYLYGRPMSREAIEATFRLDLALAPRVAVG